MHSPLPSDPLPISSSRARSTLQSRQQHRHSHVSLHQPLKHFQLSTQSLHRYQSALQSFLSWCDTKHIRVTSNEQLDDVMTAYFTSLFHRGEGLHHATYTLYGLYNDKPRLRGVLKESEAALKGWKKVEPVTRRPPMNWEVCVSLALWMATHHYTAAAVATLLAFNTYLRVSELTGLLVSHVKWPQDARTGSAYDGVAVYLPKSKTGDYQSVRVRDKSIAALLCAWITRRGLTAGESVFGLSPNAYRSVLAQACVGLGVSHVGYTPHCLRHGGATHDFVRGVPLEEILLVGRWESNKSARTYVKQGVGLMLAATLPAAIMKLGRKYGVDVYAAVEHFILPATAA
jgi:integrase